MTIQGAPEVKVVSYNTPASAMSMLKVLEGSLDRQHVSFNLMPVAVKSLDPVELLIEATVVYGLERFVLQPLLEPYADKWKAAVTEFFTPYRAFEFTIRFKEGVLKKIYTDPPICTAGGMIGVWKRIGQAQRLIVASSVANDISVVRLVLGDDKNPIAVGLREDSTEICRINLVTETIEY